MRLIDSHCHLAAPELLDRAGTHIAAALKKGVSGFILPGVTARDWQDQLDLSLRYQGVYPAAGLHPLFLEEHQQKHLDKLESLCSTKQIVAVGEIGLDFFDGRETQKEQSELFHQQLLIAQSAGLPVILHVRKAHDEVLAILRKTKLTDGGTVHAFSGSLQQAKQYINLGFTIGIGGTISYDRAARRRMVAAQLPVESIVLETDAPDIQLLGRRDEPNLPEYLVEILAILSELRKESEEYLAKQTYTNTINVFRLQNRPPLLK